MDDKTIFYIVGGTLAVLAVAISFLGLRQKEFPPAGVAGRLVLAIFTALVLLSAAYAVLSAREEQAERREHLAAAGHAASEEEPTSAEAAEENTESGEGPAPASEEEAAGDEVGAQGAEVFNANGCGSCHALTAAGATGAIGPDLDLTLANQDAAEIEESIVDPNAQIVDGFDPDIMPATYGDELSPEDLEALVAYLQFAVSKS